MQKKMALYLFISINTFLSIVFVNSAIADDYKDTHDLEQAMIDFNLFQREIDKILLGNTNNKCLLISNSSGREKTNACLNTYYCEKINSKINSPFFYESVTGEKARNELYFSEQEALRNCYKELYSDELKEKVTQNISTSRLSQVKKVFDLNQKLKASIKKNAEATKFAYVTQEMIASELATELLNNEKSESYPSDAVNPKIILSSIQAAEKKSGYKLSTETKNLIVELKIEQGSPKYKLEAEKLNEKIFPEVDQQELFFKLNQFTDEKAAGSKSQLIKNQNLYQKRAQEAYDIFKDSKIEIIKYFEGLRTKENSNSIDRAIERLKLVKFATPNLNDDFIKECRNPNAWYSQSTHTITLCPQWMNLPKMSLISTLAHELGHSVDSCNLQIPMKIKSSKADAVEPGRFELNIKMDPLNEVEGGDYIIDDSVMREKDQKSTLLKDHPMFKSIQCLQLNDSIGAKGVDKELVRSTLMKKLNWLISNKRNHLNDNEYRQTKLGLEHFDDFFDRYGACRFDIEGAHSQLEESLADKISSEVVARKMAELPKDKVEDSMLAMISGDMVSSDMPCSPSKIHDKIIEKAKELNCPNFFTNKNLNKKVEDAITNGGSFDNDSHPIMSKRYDRIFFAHPEIRKKLNCPDDGVKYCEDK